MSSIPSKAARRQRGKVTLLHATPHRNLASILRSGLRPDRARGKLKAVWLHSPAKTKYLPT
jgi:RNA:NAD 2'-phosphotransferase (TPT1/KptA family)